MMWGRAWHGITRIVLRGWAHLDRRASCDIGIGLGLPGIIDQEWARGRRRVCDGMHAFVYTPVFCLLSFRGGEDMAQRETDEDIHF